ncbi:MAG: YbaB/EbfC family nucleoid-associated protein [Planctomycetaceae bacterium]
MSMFKNLGNLATLFKQAQEMQGKMKEIQEKLAEVRVSGAAGGGMVTVEASGQQKIIAVTIEQSLIDSGDREMLEDLVRSATNQALEKAKETAAREMSQLAGGMNVPGLEDTLSKLGLNGTAPG